MGAGVLGAGASAYGAIKSGGVDTLTPRQIARKTEKGYYEQAPNQLGLNQAMQPGYLTLGSQNLGQLFYGRDASTQTYANPYYKKGKASSGPENYTQNIGASTGLIDLYKRLQPDLQNLYDAGRQADINSVNRFGGQARSMYEQLNPEQTSGLKNLLGQTQNDLNMGGYVSPDQAAGIRNNTYGHYANMGFGPGTSFADTNAALDYFGVSNQLRNQRIGNANNALNLSGQLTPDYAGFILGRTGATAGAQSLASQQQGLAYQPAQYDPYNAVAAGVGINSQNVAQQGALSQAEYFGNLGGGLTSLAGKMYFSGQGGGSGYGMGQNNASQSAQDWYRNG
jgi:hypothetical protein